MTIEIAREASAAAIASIQRYFEENMNEAIGSLGAGTRLGFFLKEIAVHEPESQYWQGTARERK